MNKKPVSILQEMMLKKGIVPNYELIHDGGGSHVNTFTYRVSCDGLHAKGTGRGKKEAKHEAASAMLIAIAARNSYPQLASTTEESSAGGSSSEVSPPPGKRNFFNAVGALQTLCADNNLQAPKYYQISDVGPPHARYFSTQCEVSTFKEEGFGWTKKEAKQDAAAKMIERLQEITGKEDAGASNKKDDKCAKDYYEQLNHLTESKSFGLKLSTCHLNIKNIYPEQLRFDVRDKLVTFLSHLDISEESLVIEETVNQFKNILEDLKVNLEVTKLKVTDDKVLMLAGTISIEPEITELVYGLTELSCMLTMIRRLIDTLIVFLD